MIVPEGCNLFLCFMGLFLYFVSSELEMMPYETLFCVLVGGCEW